MTRAQAVKDSLPVQFITSHDESGCECYFVVRATPASLTRIKAAKGKVIDIAQHAEILASGFGHIPLAQVREQMQHKYGILLPSE